MTMNREPKKERTERTMGLLELLHRRKWKTPIVSSSMRTLMHINLPFLGSRPGGGGAPTPWGITEAAGTVIRPVMIGKNPEAIALNCTLLLN
uniref:Uncharacterized protein n=1 Tax=Romanomermis culicivorax TaxID=13658 RepID=A0A915IBN7_ROMCU